MTTKERWLAAVHFKPVDHLPFWPKLNLSYPRAQEAPFCQMDLEALYKWTNSDAHMGVHRCVKETFRKCRMEEIKSETEWRVRFITPSGTMELVRQFDAPSHAWHPVQFPISGLDDIKRMTDFFLDIHCELDEEILEKAQQLFARYGTDAVAQSVIGQSALMRWVEWFAGVENSHFFLADFQEDVEALFDAMHQVLLETTRIMTEHSPADLLYLIENTSTTLISPTQYRKYCAGPIAEYAGIVRDAGRQLILHMCGHVKKILPDLDAIPVAGFEAFTSPTLGDTTLLDGRTACADKCLIGGTNAMLWLKPAKEIIAQIERDLDALDHHRGIVITSAGVMPPACKPETIKEVCQWVHHYPVKL